jgi:enamine deaminase RidA (YjgF/YER057c/UK114 family)
VEPTYHNPRNLPHRSDLVLWKGVAYLPGVMPRDGNAGLAEQTRDVLAQIDALLSQAGTSKDHLLTAVIWMSNVKFNAAGMNEVWSAWLTKGRQPVRSCIESAFQLPGLMEIMVTAAIPE